MVLPKVLVAMPQHGSIAGVPSVKSWGLPNIFQRSSCSPVPLKSEVVSKAPTGTPERILRVEFSCHPSSIWPRVFLPGIKYVPVIVKRWR